MSREWLSGRLVGVEPRSELDLIRQALVEALDRGDDVTALIQGLANLDAVAGAELIAGPRALARVEVVLAALGVADQLEQVLPQAGLYRRLADLGPQALPQILATALERHGDTGWVWRLSARESLPGKTPLQVLARSQPNRAPHRAIDHGQFDAVLERARTGDVASLRALYDRADRRRVVAALAGCLDADVAAPVVAWVAAWHGPDIDPLFAAVARRLTTAQGRRRLLMQATDLPLTLAAAAD